MGHMSRPGNLGPRKGLALGLMEISMRLSAAANLRLNRRDAPFYNPDDSGRSQ